MSSIVKIPETLLASFLSAYWIWTPEIDITNPPIGNRAFRITYTTPTGKNATSALILITVDNVYSLFVNGQRVGTSPDAMVSWESAQIFNVAPLDPQSNLFALNGSNVFDPNNKSVNPAGVLCAIQIIFSDGTMATFPSGETWKSFREVSAGFESLSTDDSTWDNSIEVARYRSGAWGTQVALPETVPQQTIISLPSPTASTTASGVTVESVPFSTSRSTTSASATSIPSNNKVNVGAIVGGVIGGVATLFVFLVIILRRRKRIHKYGNEISTESAQEIILL